MFCCVQHPLSQSIHQFSRSDPTISVQIPHFWRVFVRRRTFWQHGETFVNKKSCLRSLTWNFPRWSRINSNCFLIVVSFLSGSYLIIPQKTEQKDEHTLEEGYSSYVAVGLYSLGAWCLVPIFWNQARWVWAFRRSAALCDGRKLQSAGLQSDRNLSRRIEEAEANLEKRSRKHRMNVL